MGIVTGHVCSRLLEDGNSILVSVTRGLGLNFERLFSLNYIEAWRFLHYYVSSECRVLRAGKSDLNAPL